MSPTIRTFTGFLFFYLLIFQPINAQEEISWLNDYTEEMQIGNDTYRYKFSTLDGNDCKINIEEQVRDKKGSTESRSWVFYLSDIDPAAISFDSKGKSIQISMETRLSQKFISYYEEGEFDEYTEEIELSMNEVDMARSFISDLKENIDQCKQTQSSWENREDAFAWLTENIGDAKDDDIMWEQELSQGERPYMVKYAAISTDDDGEQESFDYVLDLNDINPLGINLDVSGKSLNIEVPVREGERFIEMTTPEEKEYVDELVIYSDDIEMARKIVNALSYVVTNTMPDRPDWETYVDALNFVKENVGEVKIDDDTYMIGLDFEDSPSGTVNLNVTKTDSDGEKEESIYSFYLHDMNDVVNLDVSRSEAVVNMETINKRDFIREMNSEELSGYSSKLSFPADNIDQARDVINAIEYAIDQSSEEIRAFENISDISTWLTENVSSISIDEEQYEQSVSINPAMENQVSLEIKVTEDGESTETRYILYPEDINTDELEIKVSGKKLTVPLETDEGKYIKIFENGEHQNFDNKTEILFADPLVAKNFIAAVKSLAENSVVENRMDMTREEALELLNSYIQKIELSDESYDQQIEVLEEGNCKMKFERVETDDSGKSDELVYEFIAADIHPASSELSVKGELIEINLITRGNEDLIKPYENGEVQNFEDEFTVYADDVLTAKKILAAFSALSESCR